MELPRRSLAYKQQKPHPAKGHMYLRQTPPKKNAPIARPRKLPSLHGKNRRVTSCRDAGDEVWLPHCRPQIRNLPVGTQSGKDKHEKTNSRAPNLSEVCVGWEGRWEKRQEIVGGAVGRYTPGASECNLTTCHRFFVHCTARIAHERKWKGC